jgi:DNA helicase HerA-like ATPase
MEEMKIGIILSGATTQTAACQLIESAEKGKVKEGMFVIVESEGRKILARISQIIPYNLYLEPGTTWSETIRKGLSVPLDIARQYEICELELLTRVNSHKDIEYPPRPGDAVFRISSSFDREYVEGIFNIKPDRFLYERKDAGPVYKGIIFFGSLSGYSRLPIPLDIEKIPMHIGVFGVTGSGKSFNVGYLIEKLVDIPKGEERASFPMIIVDAHGDYLDYIEEVKKNGKIPEWVKTNYVKRFVLHKMWIRLSRDYGELIEPMAINLNLFDPRALAEMIILFHKGTLEGADQQVNLLVNALEEKDGDFNLIFSDKALFSDFIKHVDSYQFKREGEFEPRYHRETVEAVKRALNEFRRIDTDYKLLLSQKDSILAKENFVDKITEERGVCIIDFSGKGSPELDIKTQQLIIHYISTFLLKKFIEYKTSGKHKPKFLLFILEEAQMFCPSPSYPLETAIAKKSLARIAAEGRKFGISLCLITQRPSFVDEIALTMCNTFFIHRISFEDVRVVRGIVGNLPESIARRLTRLSTGEVIISGQMLPSPFPVLAYVDYKERKVEPTIGKTEVTENF